MLRATTPTHRFMLPFGEDMVQKLLITYAQQGVNVLEKTEGDVQYDGNAIYLTLTQAETNLFKPNSDVEIQVRVLTKSNDALASKIFAVSVGDVLNDEVL